MKNLPMFVFSDTFSQIQNLLYSCALPNTIASPAHVLLWGCSAFWHLCLPLSLVLCPCVFYFHVLGALKVSTLFSAELDPQCLMNLLILLDVRLLLVLSIPRHRLIAPSCLRSSFLLFGECVYFCILIAKLFSSEHLCQTGFWRFLWMTCSE